MAGVGDGKLEINKTQSLLSKCLQYGRRIRLHTKNHLKKVIWLILFHEARIGKRAFILKIQCLNTCCSRSWTRTIFHASVNHWEQVLLTAHSTDLYWYLAQSTQQIKLETMSHKESKERTEKLLTCKLIKFQFTLVKFKYLKKNVTNYTEISLFKI